MLNTSSTTWTIEDGVLIQPQEESNTNIADTRVSYDMLNAPDYFDDMLDTAFEVNDTAFYLHFDDMLQIILMTLH